MRSKANIALALISQTVKRTSHLPWSVK